MDIVIENGIKFYNRRKLEAAKAVAGDNFDAVVAEYERLAGKLVVLETPKPTTKKVAKKTTKKRATKKTA